MKNCILLLICLLGSVSAWAQPAGNITTSKNFQLTGNVELGFLAVAGHRIQFSNSGTEFDYRRDGGQDVLFPVSRLSLDAQFGKKNTFYLLYQPLRLESQVLLQEDLIVDDMTFPANTGVKLLYNFPFYRFSYTRELFSEREKFGFAIGGTIQIRNATISFESLDGTRFRTNRDVGIVPALKIKSYTYLSDRIFVELEADGIYAPVSYLNGSDNEVVGAILDASLRLGVEFDQPVRSFLNLRYLGGGAVGTSDIDGPGDGYVSNWLNFITVTAGFSYTFGL
ncbi:MAG: hypothetical protein GYB31_07385 [Bacteroidetes bacterium]|nr:hypothetical protein [Bacteroidota bacterium]